MRHIPEYPVVVICDKEQRATNTQFLKLKRRNCTKLIRKKTNMGEILCPCYYNLRLSYWAAHFLYFPGKGKVEFSQPE